MRLQDLLMVPVDVIDLGTNPRQDYGDLKALASSFGPEGPVEPVVLHRKASPNGDGKRYDLASGGRRVNAARMLGRQSIEALVRPPADLLSLRVTQLRANSNRKALNPLEEAEAYAALLELGLSQAEIARQMGASEALISLRLSLLRLDGSVRGALRRGDINASVAEQLNRLEPEQQARAITELLSYRRNERTVRRGKAIVDNFVETREDGEDRLKRSLLDVAETVPSTAETNQEAPFSTVTEETINQLLDEDTDPLAVLSLSDMMEALRRLEAVRDQAKFSQMDKPIVMRILSHARRAQESVLAIIERAEQHTKEESRHDNTV